MPKRIITWYVAHLKLQPAYIIINTLAAITVGALAIWLIVQNKEIKHQANVAKIQASQTKDLVKQNSKLIKKVQNNRRDLIYKTCRDQNTRHDGSLTALRTLLKKSGVSQARQDEAYKQTKVLIDALVPHRNCVKIANESIVMPPKEKNDG